MITEKICEKCGKDKGEHTTVYLFCPIPFTDGDSRQTYQPPKGSGVELITETRAVVLTLRNGKTVSGVTRNLIPGYSVDVHILPGSIACERDETVLFEHITDVTIKD